MSVSHALNDGRFTPRDWALFFGVSLIWGSSFLLIAYALDGMTPGMVTLGRVGTGALVLIAMRYLPGVTVQRISPGDRMRVFALSMIWVAVPFTLFPLAQEHINSALTGLLNGATPIFVGIVATVFFASAPRGLQLVGIVAGFVGIVLISAPSLTESSSQARGVLLVLGATVCYGFAINLAGPLQAKYGAVTLMSAVLGLATIWVTPFALVSLGDNTWGLGPTAALLVLGAIGTGIAYWIMATLVGRVGGVRASFITYLIPVVSLVLGVVIRNDTVAALSLVGAVITIGGALLASRARS